MAHPTILTRRPRPPGLVIEPMLPADLERLASWIAAEGKAPPLNVQGLRWGVGGGGMRMAWIGRERVGAVAGVRFDSAYGFITRCFVQPAWRGQGIGEALVEEAIAAIGASGVGVDVPPAMVQSFAARGFVARWHTVRLTGRVSAVVADERRIVPASSVPLDTVADFDTAVTGITRREFLNAWLTQPDAASLVLRAADGTLRGWGTVRSTGDGFRIGPLHATDQRSALAIYDALCQRAGHGERICMDAPSENADLAEFASLRELHGPTVAVRMVWGELPPLRIRRFYGLSAALPF